MKKIFRTFIILLALVVIALIISYLLSGKPSLIISHVRISKPREIVFDYISDMRNELKWNPDVMFMEKVSKDSVGLGTHFRAKWHMSDTLDVVITNYQRSKSVTFQNGGQLEVRLELQLTSIGNETEMESRFIVTPHGILRAIFPIMKSKLKDQESVNMINLKKAIESIN